MGNQVGDLIFKEFKETIGKSILIIKCTNPKEKKQYAETLSVIKEKGHIDYNINSKNIQIFLNSTGKLHVKNHEGWDYED